MKQNKEIVTIANYQKLAMRTCLKSCKNTDYADFGYLSEKHELIAKTYGFDAKKIRGDSDEKLNQIREQIADEIGDCFWFIALQCELLKFDFAEVYKMKIESIYDNRILQIARRLSFVKSQCAEHLLKPLDCMKRNIAKLSSRAERGVLKGNGDSR